MKPRAVAREVAGAAEEAKLSLRETAESLASLASLLSAQPELAEVLGHPALGSSDLKSLLREASPRLSDLALACVEGLAEARGLRNLGRVASELLILADQKEGLVEARVASARTLSSEERSSLSKGLEAALGKKVRLSEEVVPALIGGVRVEAAGKVFEGSVKGQLNAMRRELRAA